MEAPVQYAKTSEDVNDASHANCERQLAMCLKLGAHRDSEAMVYALCCEIAFNS